jgi:GT2 family glycosyltransferase
LNKSKRQPTDSFNAPDDFGGKIKYYAKKVRKNINNPKKWLVFFVSILRKTLSRLAFLTKPFSIALRNFLLQNPPVNVIVSDVCKKDLSAMDYLGIRKELVDVNESINWDNLPYKSNNKTKISIVVLVLNNLGMTMRCIDSVYGSRNKTNFELIVVDNGSSASTIRGLRKYKEKYGEMILIHNKQNLNFALGNNIGFSYARGDIVIFLNNDTYVSDGWIDNLVKPLSKKSVKAVQPALFYPDNTIQCVGVVFSEKSSLGYGIYANTSKRNKVAVKSRKLQAVTGACIAVRSEEFAGIKGFDPVFINGQEDIDLCFRLRKDDPGSYCYCEVGAVVLHDEGKTRGRGKYVMQNRQVFLDRWSGVPVADDELFYKKDGYEVVKWTPDSEESIKNGLGIFIPTLKRSKKK